MDDSTKSFDASNAAPQSQSAEIENITASLSQLCQSGEIGNIKATLSHDGRFIQYNIGGNIFEVTAKYKFPVNFLGRGSHGIVWYIIHYISTNTQQQYLYLDNLIRVFLSKLCFMMLLSVRL